MVESGDEDVERTLRASYDGAAAVLAPLRERLAAIVPGFVWLG